MELKINKDEENKIMDRREIEFYAVAEDKTPSKAEIKKEICKKLNLNPELTIVVTVDQEFGMKRSKVKVHSYKNSDSLKKFELKHVIDRLNKKKDEKKEQKTSEKTEEGAKEAEKAATEAKA
ncbi:MAG: hypothetical protein ACP5RI_01110 [Candidatus Micrarchaeia archaeon]